MLPAKDKANYQGTIFINPGGPGGSGTNFIQGYGSILSAVVGPRFDILGFDPRGIGATTPLAQCFDSDSQFQIWSLQQLNLLNISDWPGVRVIQARERLVAERCAGLLGGNGEERTGATAEEWGPGRFMNTPNVATDMLKISELLGQDKLQYWGFVSAIVLFSWPVE
jgi:pimeloyl-ACP methyl ester carboxylesterase